MVGDPRVVRSRSWLGLRGQFWYATAIWLVILGVASRSFVIEVLSVRSPWLLSSQYRWLAWVLFAGFFMVASVVAVRVWRGRVELEHPVTDRRLWAATWAVRAITAILFVFAAYWIVRPFGFTVVLLAQPGAGWIAGRAAPGWRPVFTRWRQIEPSSPVPSLTYGDPRTYRTPGWYPDPVGAFDTRRYWDGYGWTPEVRPAG